MTRTLTTFAFLAAGVVPAGLPCVVLVAAPGAAVEAGAFDGD